MKRLLLLVTILLFSRLATAQVSLPFSMDVQETDVTYSSSEEWSDHIITGTITNLTDSALSISFRRVQELPSEWSTSVCFGASCFADFVDSAASEWQPHESRELLLHVAVPPSGVGEAMVELTLIANTGNPADSAHLSFSAKVDAEDAVNDQAAKIESCYPQPCSRGEALHMRIPGLSGLTDVSIVDVGGRSVSKQRVLFSNGEVVFSPSVVPGTYVLKVKPVAGGPVSSRKLLVR